MLMSFQVASRVGPRSSCLSARLVYSADPALQRAGAELAVTQAVPIERKPMHRGARRERGALRIGYFR